MLSPDPTRTNAANAAQAVQSHFAQRMERIRFANRRPSEITSFSITTASGLNRRKIFAFVDCQTALGVNTIYWWLRSTVSALSRGTVLQTWPLQVGMFNDDGSSFVDYAVSAFSHGDESVPDGLRLMGKNGMSMTALPRTLHPLSINLDCDAIRWDCDSVNPAYKSQSIVQARVFLACRSEL